MKDVANSNESSPKDDEVIVLVAVSQDDEVIILVAVSQNLVRVLESTSVQESSESPQI